MKQKFNLRRALLLAAGVFVSFSATAQQLVVKGHVKDQGGQPVVFASVAVMGTKTVVNTDANGNFTLHAPGDAKLRVSYIGYKTEYLPAAASVVVTLEDNSTLGEAMVVGYAKVKKEDATGSVTAIKPDEMSKGITTNAQDMLVGKVPGVSVITGGGLPGASAQIRVRGGSSLKASNDPLIVIDGLAMDNDGVQGLSNPLAMVNPDDIESFTVLKDASATAIYGSRASNGVIIITTKKGRVGNKIPRVTYSGNVSFGLKRKTYDVLTGAEFRAFVTDLAEREGIELSDAAKNSLGAADTDWQEEIYQTAISHDHNLSVMGSVGALPYRLSFGYTNQEGIIRTSEFERYTTALNLSPKFLDEHLAVTLNAKYMSSRNQYADDGAVGAALGMDPTRPVHFAADDPMGRFTGGYWQNMTSVSYADPEWLYSPDKNTPQNPLSMLNLQNRVGKAQSVIGNVELDYKIHRLEDLHVHANLGGDYSEGREQTHNSPYGPGENNYYGWDGTKRSYKYNLQGNIYAQYQHTFAAHNVDLMVGAEQQHFHLQRYEDGHKTDHFLGTPKDEVTRAMSESKTRNSLVSYFGRLNYILSDRYLATFTMRFDGSSRFSKDNRWGNFPSLALGWKIKEERFLKDVKALSDLKLRLGWGITGQQNIGYDFYYQPLYNIGDDYAQYPIGGDYITTGRPNAFNTDLTWEKTTTWNAGLDFAFLGGRIDGAIDYYYRHTKDLISTVAVATGTNFNNEVTKNIGALKNYGLEFSLNARPVQTRDFTWQLSYNVMWNKNQITELYGAKGYEVGTAPSRLTSDHVQINKVGYPANSFYVYQQVYDRNGHPIENCFVDRNGDGEITPEDRYVYKSPTADVLMGLTSKLMYKNWDFSFTLRASLNNYVYNDYLSAHSNTSFAGVFNHNAYTNLTQECIDLGWRGKSEAVKSDYFVQNASFLRCDNITLGYSFNNLFSTARYQGISGRLSATVQNPFVITKYDGLDPEMSDGVDKNIYPRPTTYMVGLNLQF